MSYSDSKTSCDLGSDALTRLVAQGVLQQGPRNSAIVPNLTRKELADLTVVRCALEGRAAREAAVHRHDAAALRRLEERLATVQSLIKARKLESYLEAMGGHLELVAVFDDERVPIALSSLTDPDRDTRDPIAPAPARPASGR